MTALPGHIQDIIMQKYFTSHVLSRLREGIQLLAYNKYARFRLHDDYMKISPARHFHADGSVWGTSLDWSEIPHEKELQNENDFYGDDVFDQVCIPKSHIVRDELPLDEMEIASRLQARPVIQVPEPPDSCHGAVPFLDSATVRPMNVTSFEKALSDRQRSRA